MTTPLITFTVALACHQTHAQADIYTRRKKQIVPHKSRWQFLEMDVREIRISIQNDAKHVYNLNGG